MTSLAQTNGHAPPRDTFHDRDTHLAEVFESEIADLHEMLDDELKGRRELEVLLDRSKERERRLVRAIAVLEHGSANATQTTTAKPKAAAPKSQGKGAKKSDGSWNIGESTVERVLQGFKDYAEAHPDQPSYTMTMVAAWMGSQGQGVGGETIRRAVNALREREQLRKAGTTRGGGTLYALMPTESTA